LNDEVDAEEGENDTGKYIGVLAPSLVYSSQSISMKECPEVDDDVAEAADIGLSERTDMDTVADMPCEENEEEAN
jgi:hypothetical protein